MNRGAAIRAAELAAYLSRGTASVQETLHYRSALTRKVLAEMQSDLMAATTNGTVYMVARIVKNGSRRTITDRANSELCVTLVHAVTVRDIRHDSQHDESRTCRYRFIINAETSHRPSPTPVACTRSSSVR